MSEESSTGSGKPVHEVSETPVHPRLEAALRELYAAMDDLGKAAIVDVDHGYITTSVKCASPTAWLHAPWSDEASR